jgi:hypothetical protein
MAWRYERAGYIDVNAKYTSDQSNMHRCGGSDADYDCPLPRGVMCPYHDMLRHDERGNIVAPRPRYHHELHTFPIVPLRQNTELYGRDLTHSYTKYSLVRPESPVALRPPRVVETCDGPPSAWPVDLMPVAGRAGHGRRKKSSKKK